MSRLDRTMEYAEWLQKGEELYGESQLDWEFVCENCKLTLSFTRFVDRKPELKGRGWQPYAECIGRYLNDVGCDWAAYGPFSGPREVTEGGQHKANVFLFAGEVAS